MLYQHEGRKDSNIAPEPHPLPVIPDGQRITTGEANDDEDLQSDCFQTVDLC